MSPPGLRQTAGVTDSIPRNQAAVCSQLLMLENLMREMRCNACVPSELVIPNISQHTPADMIDTTRSCVSFFLKKFRKLDFMDDNRELRVHSSFLIVLHEDALITNDPATEAAPSCYQINSYHLSNLDQTAADLLPIMARKRGDDGDRSIRTRKYRHLTQEEDIMNADQLKGKWMQFKGELKEKYGKFTDDDLKQIEGNYDKFVGKAQERYGDKKDDLMKWADQWHEKPSAKPVGKGQ